MVTWVEKSFGGMNDLLHANAIDRVIHRVREREVPGGCSNIGDSMVSQFERVGGCDRILIDVVEID